MIGDLFLVSVLLGATFAHVAYLVLKSAAPSSRRMALTKVGAVVLLLLGVVAYLSDGVIAAYDSVCLLYLATVLPCTGLAFLIDASRRKQLPPRDGA